MTTNDFYQAMLDTSLNCGIKILSDDFCCKLLAWLCMFGGEKEATTQNKKMRAEILYAQKKIKHIRRRSCQQSVTSTFKTADERMWYGG